MITTRSRSRKEPEEKHLDAITKEGAPQKEVRGTKGSMVPEDNGVVSHLKEFNFGDFFRESRANRLDLRNAKLGKNML